LDNYNTDMILCADDYGLAQDIDKAVLELCEDGKLSAVSCMPVLQRCTIDTMRALATHQSKIDIGLHLCLTNEGLPMDSQPSNERPTFASLVRQSLSQQIEIRAMSSEIRHQYDLFVAKCGRAPDFIDGHLHCHQLPGVRVSLLDFVASLPPLSRPYVRNTFMPIAALRQGHLPWIKAALIGMPGASMKRMLNVTSIQTNDGFTGIYNFKKWRKYPEYLPRFAASLREPNGILVVHPGQRQDWRKQEFEMLRRLQQPPQRFDRNP
jgi:chitin disaccharide deacetylase